MIKEIEMTMPEAVLFIASDGLRVHKAKGQICFTASREFAAYRTTLYTNKGTTRIFVDLEGYNAELAFLFIDTFHRLMEMQGEQ